MNAETDIEVGDGFTEPLAAVGEQPDGKCSGRRSDAGTAPLQWLEHSS